MKSLSGIAFIIFIAFYVTSCSGSKEVNTQENNINMKYESDEFVIKAYLADKYKPGNCFGMPTIENELNKPEVDSLAVEKVKDMYNIASDREAENLVKTMNRINLEKEGEGEYGFEFSDGRCCNITHYKGRISIDKDGEITNEEVLEKKSESVPC